MHPSPAILRFEQLLQEPKPCSRPQPGFTVAIAYRLTAGADVASLAYIHPSAELQLGGDSLEPVTVRVLSVQHPWAVANERSPVLIQVDFFVGLPIDLIERVQCARQRNGADNEVAIQIRPGMGMVCQGDEGLVRPVYDNSIRRLPVSFHRDQWLRLIGALGFTQTIVVELPLKDAHSGDVGVAQTHLRAARDAFAHGNLDDVGPRAFKAFEALVPSARGKRIFSAMTKAYFADADPEVAEAALKMLVELSTLYHKGGRHHASGTPVARHHARFLLLVAEGVVAWCAELSAGAPARTPARKVPKRRARSKQLTSPGARVGDSSEPGGSTGG